MPLLPYDYLHLVNCPEVVIISDILCSKGGCVNLVLQISPKCGQGGEGVKKSQNFADVIYGWPLAVRVRGS